MKKIISENAEKTYEIGKSLGKLIENMNISICLTGDLGAGKTHLAKGICAYFHMEEQFSSPSYTIVNRYENSNKVIYHSDIYRIESPEELYYIDFLEYLDNNTVIVEWADKAREFFLKNSLWINIEKDEKDFNKRILEFSQASDKINHITDKLVKMYE